MQQLLLLTYAAVVIQAQGWAARVGGAGDELINEVATDSQGNVYAAGTSTSSPLKIYDSQGQQAGQITGLVVGGSFLIKYTRNGTYLWSAYQDGSSDIRADVARGLAVDSLDNVLITGTSGSTSLSVYDANGVSRSPMSFTSNGVFVVKYSSNGSLSWQTKLDGAGGDDGYGLTVDSQNNFIVVGAYSSASLLIYEPSGVQYKQLASIGGNTAFGVKYLANGTALWAVKVDDSVGELAYGVAVDYLNAVYITGYYYNTAANVYDASGTVVKTLPNAGTLGGGFLVKYRANGSVEWATRQDGSNDDRSYAVACDSTGNVYVVGYFYTQMVAYNSIGQAQTTLSNNGQSATFVVKYSTTGSFLWQARIDGNNYDEPFQVVTSGSDVYVAGWYSSSPLKVYDSSGTQQKSLANDFTTFNAYLVKYKGDGSLLWAAKQDGSSADLSYGAAVDFAGSIYVSGQFISNPLVIYDSAGAAVKQIPSDYSYDGQLIKYAFDGLGSFIQTLQLPVTVSTSQTSSTTTAVTSAQATVTTVASSSTTTDITSTSSLLSPSQTVQPGSSTSLFVQAFTSSSQQIVSSSSSQVQQATQTLITQSTSFLSMSIKGFPTTSSLDSSVTPEVILHFSFDNQHSSSEKRSTTQFQSAVQGISDTSLVSNLVYYIIAALVGSNVLVVVCCVLCIRIQRANKPKFREQDNDSFRSSVEQTNMSMVTDNVTTNSVNATAIVTTHVMAVPQYMVLEYGVSFAQQQLIAKGGGGSIYHCMVLDSRIIPNYKGEQLVVKNLGVNASELPDGIQRSFYQEVSMLHLFRDQPYFAKMFGFSEQPATILLKFYRLGSLGGYIQKQSVKFPYSMRQHLIILNQISIGLKYMHLKLFAHCDIKPDNVLLEQKGNFVEPRLTDFGISRSFQSSQVKAFKLSSIKGASVAYAAPEVMIRFRNSGVVYNAEVWMAGDVYALSILMLECLTRSKTWLGQ